MLPIALGDILESDDLKESIKAYSDVDFGDHQYLFNAIKSAENDFSFQKLSKILDKNDLVNLMEICNYVAKLKLKKSCIKEFSKYKNVFR